MFFRFLFISFIVLSNVSKASEVTIIELHKNKSLDQLVLEQENETQIQNNENGLVKEVTEDTKDNSNKNLSEVNQDDSVEVNQLENENSSEIIDSEKVTLVSSESIFDIDEVLLKSYLTSINQINSQTLSKEFLKILSSAKTEINDNDANKIYFIIKKLYETGEIQKAYNLIKESNLDFLSNKEYLSYFKTIELNYLLSTFKLSDVCELKTQLLDDSVVLPNFLLEKTDIFCLSIENKLAEAKLLNSLLLEKEPTNDKNFQKLFDYTILENKEGVFFDGINSLQSGDLIFLYSAMLRINELPLTEEFIEIDPLNLAIPVILSETTPMNIRIKAANKSFNDNFTSEDILSALYQSVDFNSEQFTEPKQTVQNLNGNNELIMAFYFQLVNRQIFPEDRFRVLMEFWEFSKNNGYESIAYSLSKNIIDTFTPSLENSKYGLQIAQAHIYNKNYNKASKWLIVIEQSEGNRSQLEYIKFLIALSANSDLNTIVTFLNTINNNLDSNIDVKIIETLDVLNRFFEIQNPQISNFDYEFIQDERSMPSYFLIRDVKKNINEINNLNLFLLSLISMDRKNWHEIHPEHLKLMLETFNVYDQGSLIKPIILEVLNDLNVIR